MSAENANVVQECPQPSVSVSAVRWRATLEKS